MENKGKKMLALVAVIGLCAVALIGAGYAAFANTTTARTYNEDNVVIEGYMTLSPNGDDAAAQWSAITSVNEVDFHTYYYNVKGGTVQAPTYTSYTAYYFNNNNATSLTDDKQTVATNDDVEYKVVQLGQKTYSLKNETGDSISSLTFNVKQTKTVGNESFVYILKVNNIVKTLAYEGDIGDGIDYSIDYSASPLADNSSTNITITLYIGYVEDVAIPDDHIGSAVAKATKPNTGYTQNAIGIEDSNDPDAPEDIKSEGNPADGGLSLGFTVTNVAAPQPASP